jgi:hypothetical protein
MAAMGTVQEDLNEAGSGAHSMGVSAYGSMPQRMGRANS